MPHKQTLTSLKHQVIGTQGAEIEESVAEALEPWQGKTITIQKVIVGPLVLLVAAFIFNLTGHGQEV